MHDSNIRDYMERRKGEMRNERSSFIPHYKEISTNISPRRGRFEASDRNKGERRHTAIINSIGSQASRIATAGMFAGVMSPTRPWFDLTHPDPDLAKFKPVREWYDTVAQQMRAVYNSGNLYQMAPVMLKELLDFGTGCMSHVDDDDNIARFYAHTAGSYLIAQNDKFEIDTLVREYEMQVGQMAAAFGIENLSIQAKGALDRGELGTWIKVVQFIEPNDDIRRHNPLSKYKKFKSCKYELGNNDKDMMLKISGFDEFPAYVPRWATTGEDIYGTDCPGMQTLGDVKQLQIQEKRKAQGIDKMVNPVLTGPASLRNVPVTSLPGGLTLYTSDNGQKLESMYNVNLPIDQLSQDMQRVERRIEQGYFVDLFMAITNMEGIQPKNQLELSERNGERLLQLGPVLERMQGEFLDQMNARVFSQMVRAGVIPDAPPEIQGAELKVEYVSTLAQAQRSIDTMSIDKLSQYAAFQVSAGLSDGKKFNGDSALEEYAIKLGTSPKLVKSNEEVQEEREAEAQQAQQAQQAEMASKMAGAAAQAGQVDLEGDNLVSRTINNTPTQGKA